MQVKVTNEDLVTSTAIVQVGSPSDMYWFNFDLGMFLTHRRSSEEIRTRTGDERRHRDEQDLQFHEDSLKFWGELVFLHLAGIPWVPSQEESEEAWRWP